MSPEQARGERNSDGRSDLYALGTIVFQMLTGKFPYEADTPMGIAVKHITEPVPHILHTKPDLGGRHRDARGARNQRRGDPLRGFHGLGDSIGCEPKAPTDASHNRFA